MMWLFVHFQAKEKGNMYAMKTLNKLEMLKRAEVSLLALETYLIMLLLCRLHVIEKSVMFYCMVLKTGLRSCISLFKTTRTCTL